MILGSFLFLFFFTIFTIFTIFLGGWGLNNLTWKSRENMKCAVSRWFPIMDSKLQSTRNGFLKKIFKWIIPKENVTNWNFSVNDISRFHYSSRHFIIPVVVYSLLYNLPKLFELSVACPVEEGLTNNNENTSTNCSLHEMKIAANDIR